MVNGEKVYDVISKVLTDKLKLADMSDGNFHVYHHLGSSENKLRPVLVKFQSMKLQHTVWDSKTLLKGSGMTISEFLTKSWHHVFTAARQYFGLNKCWTTEGKIVVLVGNKVRPKIE